MCASRFTFFACCLVIGAFLAGPFPVHALPVGVAHIHTVSDPAAARATIIVYISRSTNTCALTLVVNSNGDITIKRCSSTKVGALSTSTVTKLFNDVHRALPLTALPQGARCAKSISFGTSTRIAYGSQMSPDLSCSPDAKGRTLYHDVTIVVSEVNSGTP
ncbi:hypothetical protein KDW_60620 [Dictyobacter vulcani]|uniref:Spore coat protein U domain-containing protein n=1 Tax=Dictyobacter vulcani TaxID=2607529 RepID=A0A5J4KZA7_9CHLR|nr:hypothetical protein [Dictyobacter vulcani]GER91900.1 hypothetical protein KDW_60620 [Dictyobacter vulcani]